MSQYAASLHPRRRVEERALASLWLEGNAADDAFLVDQGRLSKLTHQVKSPIL
ncbi:MAG: hypothetical protein V1758_12020 [Pseudomonadota bacterium]